MLPLSAEDPRTIGEFRLHARLGAGGMGRVYLASSPGGRAVAVKVVHSHLARDGAFLTRFRREVAAAQTVNGGYAAPVIATGPFDDPPWLATAYVAGPSLQEAVTAAGPLPEDAVLKLTAGLAEALRAIHDCGLVHRDLKPGNVLLAADGPRVIDFGIARALEGTALTSAESLLGTPSFMSPEQAQSQPAGPASDVFSLGGVMFFAATGTYPFGTGHPAAMLFRIVHSEPELERMPPRLRELAAACLAKAPDRRPTPAQLGAALMGVVPPGDSPAAFWPAPVARLISSYQSQLGLDPPAAAPPFGDAPPPVGAPPPAGGPPFGDAPPPTTEVLAYGAPPVAAPPAGYPPAAAPPFADQSAHRRTDGQAGHAEPPPVPGMGRRRALATLAGMATGGLIVAGYELARPRKPPSPAAGQATVQRTAKPLPPPGTRVWSFDTKGTVHAIAISGGTVFAGTANNTVFALDAATGRQLWRRTTVNAFNDQLVAAGKAVYIADGIDGGVYALDAATGRQLWTYKTAGIGGFAAAGDVLYLGDAVKNGTTGGVTALSTHGDLLWTDAFGPVSDVTTGVVVTGGTVYATSSSGEIFAYDAASGTKRWRTPSRDADASSVSPPVVAGGAVYACVIAGEKKVARLHSVHAATGRVLWRRSAGTSQFAANLAVANDVLYASFTRSQGTGLNAGDLDALNAATGQPRWKIRVAGGVDPAAAVDGGVVYSGSNNGVLTARHADTGHALWNHSVSGLIGTQLFVADGLVYFSAEGEVYAVAAQR